MSYLRERKKYLLELELLWLYHNLELHVGITTRLFNKPDGVRPRLALVCYGQGVFERNADICLLPAKHDVFLVHAPLLTVKKEVTNMKQFKWRKSRIYGLSIISMLPLPFIAPFFHKNTRRITIPTATTTQVTPKAIPTIAPVLRSVLSIF